MEKIAKETEANHLFVSTELMALLRNIDLLPDKPIKLWSTVTEIMGYVKVLELEHDSVGTATSRFWLEKVQKAAQYANHLLDPANLTALSDKNIEDHDSVIHHIWSRFDCLFQERKGLLKIQSQAFDKNDLLIFGLREVLGRDSEKKWMFNWIIQEEDSKSKLQYLSTLSICGEEGIGKTSLARFFFDEEMVRKHFRVRAWASSTCGEVDLVNTARGIVASATGLSCLLNDLAELDDAVRDTLQASRALIVLDNVQLMKEETWLHMLHSWFCVLDSGSKVILTTSSKSVAETDQQFELGRLPHDASWSLFSSIAFDACTFDENYEALADYANYLVNARIIATRCLGNPLLLKIWGSLVRFRRVQLPKNLDHNSDLYSMLNLSYLCLPDSLRQCLELCALYPKGYTLNRDWLIQMWTARGLTVTVQEETVMENTALANFHQLVPFFNDFNWDENGNATECQLPGLIHQLIEDVAGITSKKEGGVTRRINKNGRQASLEFVNESLTIPLAVNFDAQHLQTLLVSGKFFGNLSSSIPKFKCVTILELSSTGVSKLTSRIDTLKQLKYLNMSNTLIRRLPNTIASITGLQTLKLAGCHNLQQLPRTMHSLINLRHLEFQLCDSLLYLPPGIGKLTYLQSISSFVLGRGDKCACLSELQNLKHLKGKLAIENLENVRSINEAQEARLREKKCLEHLKLSWNRCENRSSKLPSDRLLLECLLPHSNLKSLDIHGYMSDEFPLWLHSLRGLTKLSLHDCGCEVLPPLGQLHNLKELFIEGMSKVKTIGQEFYGDDYSSSGFDSLEQLEIRDMPSLSDWSSAFPLQGPSSSSRMQAFPCLKTLTIDGCPKLEVLPHFLAVESLVVSNSNPMLLSSLPNIPSLSSLLIRNILLKDSFENLRSSISVNKLIMYDCHGDPDLVMVRNIVKFPSLTHLGIFNCHDLKHLDAWCFSSLHKLDIVDCRNLRGFKGVEPLSSLGELILDGCPALESLPKGSHFTVLEKLVIQHCTEVSSLPEKDEMLAQLRCLSISRCPRLQEKLQRDTGEEWFKISHIPRVIDYSGSERTRSQQDQV